MALSKDRPTPRRNNLDIHDPLAANVKIYAGAIIMLNAAGFAVPGSTDANLKPRGVAQEFVDNSGGADGDANVSSMKGCFRFKNDGSVNRTDIGSNAYVVDDETVADSDGAGTRSALGEITDVDAMGVWVLIA